MSQNIVSHPFFSEIKNTLSIGVPLIASQMIFAFSNFIGTAMVGHLGKDALAASVLVSMTWFSLSVLFFGLLNAVSVLVAHQFGAKNDKAISEIMGQSYLLGIIICLLIILSLMCLPMILRWSGEPSIVLHLADQYIHALLFTVPGLVVLIISEQFLAGVGRTKVVLHLSFMIVPIEIPLIYLLIFGKGGLPALGIAGVGYGLSVTYSVTAIGLSLYLLYAKPYQRYRIFSEVFGKKITYLKELIRIGLPMGLMQAIEVSAFAVATIWMGHFGTTVLAAHQIVVQYLAFAITIVFAMSQAVTVRVGHAVGEQDLSSIRSIVNTGILLNFCLMFLISMAFCFFPTWFLSLDIDVNASKNMALVKEASAFLVIIAVLILLDNFRIIGFGALRGLKDTYFSMVSSFVGFWLVGLSLSFLLGFHFHFEGQGIWWGLTLGIASGASMVLLRLQYLLRRQGAG